jgi:thiosulfate reductase cytochrome b subunit
MPSVGDGSWSLRYRATMVHRPEPASGALIRRHRLAVRLWHWANALAVLVMLMSGLMIFNAHPHLYWGKYGANFDRSWLDIVPGHVRLFGHLVPTPGLLGVTPTGGRFVAFPPWATLPSHYDLAGARQWHFAFAWLLVVPGIAYLLWTLLGRHLDRDLLPRIAELRPRHLLRDIADHARLRFPKGEAAARYNVLQKLAYLIVLFGLLPGAVLTGLTLSPAMDAAWPWLLVVTGGRQTARSIHFLCAMGLTAFIAIHLIMVVLAGPINELRSMITGWYRLPRERS